MGIIHNLLNISFPNNVDDIVLTVYNVSKNVVTIEPNETIGVVIFNKQRNYNIHINYNTFEIYDDD